MKKIAIFLLLFEVLFGGVEIKRDGEFATVKVNEPQRGDFNFVLFHNQEPVVIECRGGVCSKKIKLKEGENSFEWKRLDGLANSSSLKGGAYTIEVFDCKNNRPIDSGELLINGRKFTISHSRVKIYDFIDSQIKINPKIKGFTSKGEIKRVAKVGKVDKICLYPMVKLKKEGSIGDPRFNISWNPSFVDIDIRVITPCNKEINFKKKFRTQKCRGFVGRLDIDIREKQCIKRRFSCQENITFDNGGPRGEYVVRVQKYKGSSTPTDITLTIINNGEKRIERFTLFGVKDERRFRVIH